MYKSEKLWLLFPVGQSDGKKDGFEVRTHVMNDQALSALKEKACYSCRTTKLSYRGCR
uniref:CopG protein n=1 Tax=Klebsiella pneumoniae TaxID=573 RepID=A0A8B0STG7_KLEPN|nr:CopG protein [Klebsiella pneumoniae]